MTLYRVVPICAAHPTIQNGQIYIWKPKNWLKIGEIAWNPKNSGQNSEKSCVFQGKCSFLPKHKRLVTIKTCKYRFMQKKCNSTPFSMNIFTKNKIKKNIS